MSLNGLDTPAVQEAYQQAVTEAGGWFLLKYTSRDSVELLGRGKNGVHEARLAISKYEDQSPLYGVIIYRRRKILIKYIPEATTRLLQARTAVHFQDVAEKYSPYETLLEITTAEGLNDTSLAASFPLHTASPSTSSNRLHEISEDAEDSGSLPARPAVQTFASTGSIFGTQRYKMEKRVDQLMGPDRPKRNTPSIQVTSDSMSTLSSSLASPQKTSLSQFLVRDDSGQRSITSIGSPSSIASVTEYADSEISDKSTESTSKTDGQPDQSRTQAQKRAEQARQASQPSFIETSSYAPGYAAQRLNGEPSDRSVQRSSTQDRPSLSEIRKDEDEPFDFSYLDFKPKVKLGPRPVAVGEKTKRPPVAGVAAVPATYRPALQKKQEPTPPQPHIPVIVPAPAPTPSVLPRPPPIPDIPEYNPRPVSRGSVKSLPSHKSTTMTPDKIRLMKAVELRKKQLRKSNPQPSTFAPRKKESVPSVPNLMRPPELRAAKQSDISFEPEIQPDHERQAPSKKPDSGIEMGYERHEKLEEGPQTSETSEESKSPLADPTTLAQLQPSPPADRQSLRLDTAGPRSVDTSADTGVGAEPTISLDMLEDPRIPMFRNPSYNDSPTLGRAAEVERLGIATPPQRSMSHVPTIAMPDGSRLLSSNGKQFETGRPDNDRRADTLKEDSGDLSRNSSNGTLDASMESHRHHDALAKRRRGIVAPLRIDPNADGNFSSDDEFLEELQSATFQQAKPISMKSPMAPSFTRKPSSQSVVSNHSGHSVRSINIRRSSSNLLEQYTYSPDQLSPGLTATPPMRSHSMITPPSERGDPMQALRRNGSTGVTKRIQALAEGSSNEISADDASRPLTPEAAAHSTWRERKSAVRSPPKPRTSSFRTLSRHSNKSSGYPTPPAVTPSAYPHPEPVWNVQHDSSSNRDSVSVTARIVRSYIDDEPAQAEGALQQSQLVINHKRASASTSRIDKALAPLNTNTNLNVSPPPKSESAPMVSSPQTEYRQLHSLNRRSFGRHRQVSPISPSAEDFPPPPTHARASYTSSNDEHAAYKEGSRTSRFFKRMSNLGGGHKRRNSGPQSMPHALDVSSRTGSVATTDRSDMPPAVVIGDLNVQFPDSLLWKRRIVEIDANGNLIFAVSQAMDVQKAAVKKYHLSEFRIPYAPDLDRQELPHSVVLDFVDGTILQAACEDAMTHRQVLHLLRSYWKAWAGVA